MRLVVISDTHGLHNGIEGLPDGDVLVYAGDFMNAGFDQRIYGRSIAGWKSSRSRIAWCAAGIMIGISRTVRIRPAPFLPMLSTLRTPGSLSTMSPSGDRRTLPSF